MATEIDNQVTNISFNSSMDKESSKNYLYASEIPHLFECLMSGLIHHQPTDHISFLRNCLTAIKQSGGVDELRWDSFIESDPTKGKSLTPSRLSSKRFSSMKSTKTRTSSRSTTTTVEVLPVDQRLVDAGRKPDLSLSAPLILLYVGPVSSKGAIDIPYVSEIVEAYTPGFAELDDMEDEKLKEEILLKFFADHETHPVILINYPRTENQLQWLLSRVGGISSAAFIDYGEEEFRNRVALTSGQAIASVSTGEQVTFYKQATIPLIHWLDQNEKLKLINGSEGEEQIHKQVMQFLDKELHYRARPKSTSSTSLQVVERTEYVEIVPYADDLPVETGSSSVCLLFVGPVPNFGVHKIFLANKVHKLLEPNSVMEKLPALLSEKNGPIVCLNFPADRSQFDWLVNTMKLNISKVIVVDNTEITLRTRLVSSHMSPDTVDETVREYKLKIVPIIHWFDRAGKVTILDGEKDDALVMKSVVDALD